MKFVKLTLVLSMISVLTGCGTLTGGGEKGEESEPRSINMNMKEAAVKADGIMRNTFKDIRPPVRWTHGESTDRACNDTKNESTGSGTVTRRAAVMTEVSKERRGAFLGVVERAWKKRGFTVTGTDGDDKFPSLFVKTPEGFRLGLEIGYKGQAFFDIVTPCAKNAEVPPPSVEPNGPDYSGQKIPSPNVQDDFWSQTAPAPSHS